MRWGSPKPGVEQNADRRLRRKVPFEVALLLGILFLVGLFCLIARASLVRWYYRLTNMPGAYYVARDQSRKHARAHKKQKQDAMYLSR